mgnify:CR=1 FL=1
MTRNSTTAIFRRRTAKRCALQERPVVLCVTGGIAAYKAADLTSKLHQNGAEVRVLMTESAAQFISPMTFETLSGNRAVVDTFDRSFPWEVEHISLAKAADVFVIAPATANVIAKRRTASRTIW